MRFIYLSTTADEEFTTKESTIETFKGYLYRNNKFLITERKIDRKKFQSGEDIFFLRAEKEFGYYTYKIVAYCRAGSNIIENENIDNDKYPFYFVIDSSTLRIFKNGIDVYYVQKFIDNNQDIKQVNFTGSIDVNAFRGHQPWIYFDIDDSKKIISWFREIIRNENIQMICKL